MRAVTHPKLTTEIGDGERDDEEHGPDAAAGKVGALGAQHQGKIVPMTARGRRQAVRVTVFQRSDAVRCRHMRQATVSNTNGARTAESGRRPG